MITTSHNNVNINEEEFEPKIIGFLCNWCPYAGADRAMPLS